MALLRPQHLGWLCLRCGSDGQLGRLCLSCLSSSWTSGPAELSFSWWWQRSKWANDGTRSPRAQAWNWHIVTCSVPLAKASQTVKSKIKGRKVQGTLEETSLHAEMLEQWAVGSMVHPVESFLLSQMLPALPLSGHEHGPPGSSGTCWALPSIYLSTC